MGPQATNKTNQADQPQRASTPQKTAEASSPSRQILQLQRKIGNQGVLRMLESGQLQRRRPGDTDGRAEGHGAEESRRLAEVQRPPPAGVVQRQAALEEERPLAQRMTEDEKEPMQGQFIVGPAPVQRQGKGGGGVNATGMPGGLKAGLEGLSGKDLSGVRVHRNSSKPAQVNALAYTQGKDIHVAPGQEKHLPHEGWHAVQQMQGRVKPTMQAKGVSINDDAGLEREADVMGAKALQWNLFSKDGSKAKFSKNSDKLGQRVVIQRSPISWLIKKAGKKVAMKIVKNYIKKNIKSKIRQISKEQVKQHAKRFAKQADDILSILIDPWWFTVLEMIPFLGDALGAGRFAKQLKKVWKRTKALERQVDRVIDQLRRIKLVVADSAKKFRTTPANLTEQVVMKSAKTGQGKVVMGRMTDPRLHDLNVIKMQLTHVKPDGTKVVVHYMRSLELGKDFAFKFK